ncbi:hypothetical protein [Nonomuraea sediminis]|uniref:hypothetical protein n=1 Tax=Nonomuraea sediminis TaxID=2835864 RepID=UPI001BDC2948|nr:hypothetical protein [Nonomuraea sediminis]
MIRRFGLLLALLVLSCSPTRAPAPPPPTPARSAPLAPLTGVAPPGPTGVRLLATGGEPFVYDVDSRASTPVSGLPSGDSWGFGAGARAVIGVGTRGLYALAPGASRARFLTAADFALASADGGGVWVQSGKRCRELRFGGGSRTAACAGGVDADTQLGLLIRPESGDMRLADPATGRVLLRAQQILAVARGQALVSDGGRLTLVDVPSGRKRALDSPRTEGSASHGLPSPDGRWIAVPFGDPAWPGPRQYLDVWVLEISSGRWSRLPGMPVPAALKALTVSWLPDGRLALAGAFPATAAVRPDDGDYAGMLALWRPGEPRLAVTRLPFVPRPAPVILP